MRENITYYSILNKLLYIVQYCTDVYKRQVLEYKGSGKRTVLIILVALIGRLHERKLGKIKCVKRLIIERVLN